MFLDLTSFLKECDLNYFQNCVLQFFSCYLLYFSVFYIWNEKLDHLNDVDEMCEKFTKCFLKIAQECIPTKIITIRNNDRPWFNNEIRKEIRIRDRFRKTVLKFHRERDIKLYKKTEK
jgi:hypothetical protein